MQRKSAKANSPARKTFTTLKRAGAGAPRLIWDRALEAQLRAALAEDLGSGDVTSNAVVPARMQGRGELLAKAQGVLCGAPVFERVFQRVSPRVRIRWRARDGARIRPGQVLAELSGPYRALLAGERLALNFIQQLSGVATMTARMQAAAGGARGPAICDTRKTTPLWRKLERYAVRTGGGTNHRFGLFDMVLIKDNHIRAAGNLAEAIRRARAGAPPGLALAAEASTEAEARAASELGVDLILLDNMKPQDAARIAARHRAPGVMFEISGGVNLANVSQYARSKVDRISAGALTHSAPALDLSLELYPI